MEKTTCPKCKDGNAVIERAHAAEIRSMGEVRSYTVDDGKRVIRCWNPICGEVSEIPDIQD